MIRIATEKDIPAILAIYGPYVEDTTVSFEYTVPTEDAFLERFRTITAQFPWLVWEEEGRVLGYAYGSPPYARAAYGWCAEPSVYLAPQAHRKGIGTALYAALEMILALQGYHVLYALVTSENEVSMAFHEKNGYAVRAVFPACAYKFGRVLGVTWLEKRLKSVETPSVFPVSWQAIVSNDQILADILDSLSLS